MMISKKLQFTIIVSFFLLAAHAQIKWPAVTQTSKPWTRWWWEGSAVNQKDLTWNLEQYQKVGLGGVEITPIYGIHGAENEFIDFLSPKWMQMFDHTLAESKRLGLGVDLANATGWPFGGPWVTDADASKTIYYKTYTVAGGSHLTEPVEYKQAALIRSANPGEKDIDIEKLVQPVSANKDLQSLAFDQIQYPGKLPLKTLMAYSDAGKIIDITKNVDATGKLNWTAPEGKWTLYALFEGLHGKMVERAAPGGEGYAIDHFSADAAKHYFKKFDNAFKGHDLSYLRGFFNDSYEVDDARGQANWTPGFFAEFTKRIGYDLRDQLPALFGKDNAEKNSRVRYDYRSVIDELLLENFTKEWKKWGDSKHGIVRNQSHGSPANTLDLYSVVDIPETEGTDILRFKFATSAANVTGKKLASSESATWLNEHFMSSWGDVKKAIDLYFIGGVNHIFYHGTAYSPKDAPWPGRLFYAAVHFQPVDPQWKDFHALNAYITKVQSFLQQAKPDNDILVYYPIVDRYQTPERELLQHFDGMGREFAGTDFQKISEWMLDHSYSFDFFSDKQLKNISNSGSELITGGNKYQTILLPANEFIPEATFKKLIDLASAGATILAYKNLPTNVPGFAKLEERKAAFQALVSKLKFSSDGAVQKAIIGKGSFIVSNDMDVLLKAAHTRTETLQENGLQFIRKKNAEGTLYFINNKKERPFDGWISLSSAAATVAMFDAMNTKSGFAKIRTAANGNVEVKLQLQPFESTILQLYSAKRSGNSFQYIEKSGDAMVIKGTWTLEFLDGGPVLPPAATFTEPVSWIQLDGDAYKNFSGTGKYTVNFSKPAVTSNAWLLDLGKVNETAEVILNGKSIATLTGPTFNVLIPATDLKADNKLEIVVANLMANRIAYMDRNNLPWKIFYNTNMPARKSSNSKNGLFTAAAWEAVPSGLSGPVTLTPVTFK